MPPARFATRRAFVLIELILSCSSTRFGCSHTKYVQCSSPRRTRCLPLQGDRPLPTPTYLPRPNSFSGDWRMDGLAERGERRDGMRRKSHQRVGVCSVARDDKKKGALGLVVNFSFTFQNSSWPICFPGARRSSGLLIAAPSSAAAAERVCVYGLIRRCIPE